MHARDNASSEKKLDSCEMSCLLPHRMVHLLSNRPHFENRQIGIDLRHRCPHLARYCCWIARRCQLHPVGVSIISSKLHHSQIAHTLGLIARVVVLRITHHAHDLPITFHRWIIHRERMTDCVAIWKEMLCRGLIHDCGFD